MGVPENPVLPRSVSVVTTCRDRLPFLQVALPTWLALPVSEIVVVDAGCTQGTAQWVRGIDDRRVRLVEAPSTEFSPSAARNAGARTVDSDVLAFLDSDILTTPTFATVLAGVQPGEFLRPRTSGPGITGQCVVNRADFELIGGYDEAFRGYGYEDVDLYQRLHLYGVPERRFPTELLRHLPHGNEMRIGSLLSPNLAVSSGITATYGIVKLDLMRLTASQLPLTHRRELFDKVEQLTKAAWETGKPQTLLHVMPVVPLSGMEIARTYRMVISPPGEEGSSMAGEKA